MRDNIKKFLGIFLCTVLALGGFSNVFASSDVLHISSVEITSKSAGVEAETPSVENDHVQGDVVFNAQGDHIEYLFTIENTDDYAYRIDDITDNNSTEKLTIAYSHGEKIEAKSTASFTMLMEYSEQLVNQEKLDLSDLQIKIRFTRIGGSEDEEKEEDIDVNPDTATAGVTNVVANGALASSAVILVIVFALHGTLPKQLKYAGIGTALLLAGSAISLNIASAAQSEEIDIQFSNIELVGIIENYTVTIDTGNGPVEYHYDYGTPLSEILSRPSKTGYHFDKWVDGDGNTIDENGTITGPIDIVAVMEANKYHVVFDANGGTGSMDSQEFTYDEAAKKLSKNTFERPGYNFAGWATTTVGRTKAYDDEEEVRNLVDTTEDVNLYAMWTKLTDIAYTVKHRYAGLTGGYDEVEREEAGPVDEDVYPPVLERDGFNNPATIAPIRINPDGSTVVVLEYSRKSYTFAYGDSEYIDMNESTSAGDYAFETPITVKSKNRNGYQFAGWSDGSNIVSTNNPYTFDLPLDGITLTPTYEANTYHVAFHANGGTGDMAKQEFTFDDESKALSKNLFERAGYDFAGWATSADGEVAYADKAEVRNLTDGTEDVDLYAKWTANTYNVVFHANEGTGSMDDQTFTYDEAPKALAKNTFERVGYSFAGWAKTAAGEVEYTDEQEVQNLIQTAGTVDLYAKWTANTYNVSFHANGGDGSMNDQSFTYGEAAKALTANAFTRTGYSFDGWALTVDGEKAYDDGAQVQNLTSNVDLYARWVANNYTVIFHSNDGSDSTESQEFTFNEPAKNLRKNTFERTGYSFAGWATTADGAKAYDDEEQVQNLTDTTNDVDLYAIWTANTYSVSFHANGGDGSMNDQSFTYGEAAKALTINTFTREGYSFAGWSTTAGGEVEYADGASVQNLTSDIDLYALWNANTYHVIFHSNDGNDSTESQEFVFDEAAKALRANSFAREGYSFAGWAESDSGEVVYADEAQVRNLTTTTEDVNLYAKWTANTYYVTFHANNGAGSMEKQPFTYGEAAKALTANAFTRAGYSFAGWAESDSGEVVYADEAQVQNLTSDIDLYAKWTANAYTVVFHSNEGSDLTESQEFTYDEGSKALRKNTFTYAGYSFIGWAESASGQVVYDDEEEVENLVETTEDVNLYAKWEARADIPYLVIHHYEKLTEGYDDVEDPREDGRVDQDVQLPIQHVDGFVDPAIRLVPIAADGTTVEHYYYLRERVDFTLNDPDNHVTTETGTGEYKYGATISLVAEDVPGYGFTGWSDGQSIVSTNASYSFEITMDVTLTPSYVANTYNVIFNANGGTGSMDAQAFTYDAQATALTVNTFTRAGYIFAGWATNPNGEIVYADEQQVQNLTTTTDDFNLYAKWTLRTDIEYTVHHRYENVDTGFTEVDKTEYGSVDTDITPPTLPETGFEDPVVDASTPVPTRISADGSSEVIYNYYRIHKTLTINDSEYVTGGTSGSYKYGKQFELTAVDRLRYEFEGWTTDGGETIVSTNKTYSLTLTDDVTIQPVYDEAQFYDVFRHDGACEFDGNGNVTGDDCGDNLGYIDTGVKLYDEANYNLDYEIGFTIDSLATEQVDQATFLNAKYENSSSSAIGTGLVLRKGGQKSLEISHAVNGYKKAEQYNVTAGSTVRIIRFNGAIYYSINGGTLTLLQSVRGTSDYKDTVTWFGASYDTYTESPWRYLNGTLSNMYIKLGTYDGPTATVTFNANGGTVSPESITLLAGRNLANSGYEELPTPTDNGSLYFIDWYLDKDAWNQRVTESTVFDSDTTIYARWEASSHACAVFYGEAATYKDSLSECISSVPDNTEQPVEVALLRKIEAVSVNIPSTKKIYLDGRGLELAGNGSAPIIRNWGTLYLVDVTLTGNSGQGTVNNGTDESHCSVSSCLLYIDGGKIESGTKQALYNRGGYVEIYGGAEIVGKSNSVRATVHNLDSGEIKIIDASVTSQTHNAVLNAGASGKIYIGTSGDGVKTNTPIITSTSSNAVETAGEVYFYDGTITAKKHAINKTSTPTAINAAAIVNSPEPGYGIMVTNDGSTTQTTTLYYEASSGS